MELRAASALLDRYRFANMAGLSFGDKRDLYAVLGYSRSLCYADYRAMYTRGGIAKRIVEFLPNATWRGGSEIIEDENPENITQFEQLFLDLDDRLHVWSTCLKADILAGLSTFSVMLIGAPGDLSDELPKGKGTTEGILYLTPFSGDGGPRFNRGPTQGFGADSSIQELELDITSPRFGLPKFYQLRRVDIASPEFQHPVHWSRIIHVAEGCLEDAIFGQPTLENVANLLMDLEKVTGGGAEAFWLRANQGFNLNVDADAMLSDAEKTALKDQAEEYQHEMRRWLFTRKAEVKALGSDVANFNAPADAIVSQIAGSKGIPKRSLLGSEQAELASSQDRENLRDVVSARQTSHAEPNILRQLVDRLIAYNYLSKPKNGKYQVKWSTIETLTEQEKVEGAKAWALVNQTQGAPVYTASEIRDKWSGLQPLDDKDITAEQDIKKAAMPELAPIVAPKKLPFVKAAEGYKFSSTQVNLPTDIAADILSFPIAVADLAADGRETDPHVTVKYGLHTSDAAVIREALYDAEPVTLYFGETSYFAAPDYDVLIVLVESDMLVSLNSRLSRLLDVTDTHPQYQPHATIAYLKSGCAAQYAGDTRFVGRQCVIDSIDFRPAEGDATSIALRTAGGPGSGWTAEGGHVPHKSKNDYLLSHKEAFNEIAVGNHATIAHEDLRKLLLHADKKGETADLSKLTLEGSPIFAGGLNLDRSEMPQISKEAQPGFLASLKQQNISVKHEDVSPKSLVASQNEINAARVGTKLREFESGKKDLRPILISKDNKVLDGHHRWAVGVALQTDNPNVKIPAIRIMVNHGRALAVMHTYAQKHGLVAKSLQEHEMVSVLQAAIEANNVEVIDAIIGTKHMVAS